MRLTTIYTSNIPIDCHILRGRLESDGLSTFIFDEHLIWIYPFYAVAVGGVKLKVPSDQAKSALLILRSLSEDLLVDDEGSYDTPGALNEAIARQNEILKLKSQVRADPASLENTADIKSDILAAEELNTLIAEEQEYRKMTNRSFRFTWKEFWGELFDFEGRIFQYLRPRPVEYYLEKELVERYRHGTPDSPALSCPECNSENVSFGYAIDNKWDIPYLFLSLVIMTPFPPVRKNYHCFDCGCNFSGRKNNK